MEVFVQNTQISPAAPPVRNVNNVQAEPKRADVQSQQSQQVLVSDVAAVNGDSTVVVVPPTTPTTDKAPSHSSTTHLKEEDISDFMIDKAFDSANKAVNGNFKLSYGTHEPTGRITVAVHDAETGDLICEVPPESRLDLYVKITEFVGLLFDQSS